jgi:hypothetical protein
MKKWWDGKSLEGVEVFQGREIFAASYATPPPRYEVRAIKLN